MNIETKIRGWVKKEYNAKLVDAISQSMYANLVEYENHGTPLIEHDKKAFTALGLITNN